jgi:hypothetical protein
MKKLIYFLAIFCFLSCSSTAGVNSQKTLPTYNEITVDELTSIVPIIQ